MTAFHPHLDAVCQAVIGWYRENRKAYPWRVEPSGYHVWLSEIMLQQTRIETVLPYYERFLTQWPTVEALSKATEEKLLKQWEGLGYYSRVRNLSKAAKTVMTEYGGELPHKAEQLKKLPGIGEYTAGAIASIAYGEPEPAVDGNVLRVMMRLAANKEDVLLPATRRIVTEALKKVYPSGEEAGLLTEGLMELGEQICLPNGAPKCEHCPAAGYCAALKQGNQTDYPTRTAPKERRREEKTVLRLKCGQRYALVRRPEKGLLAGMWAFYHVDGHLTEQEVVSLLHKKGISPLSVVKLKNHRHLFSHIEWQMIGYEIEVAEPSPHFIWKTKEEIRHDTAMATAFRPYRVDE